MVEVFRASDQRRVFAEVTDPDEVVVIRTDGAPVVRARPDRRGAFRACGMARRVLSVTFRWGADGCGAEVSAIWHRLPHTVALPVGAAAALLADGVPGFVAGEARR